jgi:hypothetical protein
MPNYKEQTVTGESWQRCQQVVVENHRSAAPSVRFDEEKVVALAGGEESRKPMGSLVMPYDPQSAIEMRDPTTGELTGETVTQGAVYEIMYSAYMQAALARDEAAQSTEEPLPGGSE